MTEVAKQRLPLVVTNEFSSKERYSLCVFKKYSCECKLFPNLSHDTKCTCHAVQCRYDTTMRTLH